MLSFMAEDEKTDAVREARATVSVTSFPSFLSSFRLVVTSIGKRVD